MSQIVVIVISFLLIASLPVVQAEENKPDCQLIYLSKSKKLDSILKQNTPDPDNYFNTLHNFETQLFDSLASCPDNPRLYTLMGEVQIALNNLQFALLYARKAMKLDGNYWETYHLLGNTLCMQDQCKQGLTYLEKAAELAPEKPELVFNLCNTYVLSKLYQKAVSKCSQVLARKDHQLHGPTYYLRGKAHQALEMTSKARQDFNNARLLGYTPPK